MTEKELLYIEDAIHHEIYMIQSMNDAKECLMDENLVKIVKKLVNKHETLLNMFMDLL